MNDTPLAAQLRVEASSPFAPAAGLMLKAADRLEELEKELVYSDRRFHENAELAVNAIKQTEAAERRCAVLEEELHKAQAHSR